MSYARGESFTKPNSNIIITFLDIKEQTNDIIHVYVSYTTRQGKVLGIELINIDKKTLLTWKRCN